MKTEEEKRFAAYESASRALNLALELLEDEGFCDNVADDPKAKLAYSELLGALNKRAANTMRAWTETPLS
jgi:hypothetical protein